MKIAWLFWNYLLTTFIQWRSQPKILGLQKIWGRGFFYFRQTTVFCLGYRFSKHKM